MLPTANSTLFENFVFASGYILIRAAFFYSLFMILYRFLNGKIGIVKDLPSAKQIAEEKSANIKGNIFEIVLLFGSLSLGIVPFNTFSWPRFIGTFFFCYMFFELWFYVCHRMMHGIRMRSIHRTHHVSVITTPLSALTLSYGEIAINEFGKFVVPCLLGHYFPLVFEGIMAYHLYNFYINVLGHSNLEVMPKWFVNSFLGKIFVTSTYHSLHHLKGTHNYGLFLTIFDRLFGTYDDQYFKHYHQVRDEKGLTRKGVLLSLRKA